MEVKGQICLALDRLGQRQTVHIREEWWWPWKQRGRPALSPPLLEPTGPGALQRAGNGVGCPPSDSAGTVATVVATCTACLRGPSIILNVLHARPHLVIPPFQR